MLAVLLAKDGGRILGGVILNSAKKQTGVIYILTNPSFPDYVKIGYAADIEKRLKQLNKSETIPFAFRVYAIYEVESKLTDKELHRLIDTINPDLRTIETFDGKTRTKEFYAMTKEDAYSLLECIAKISGTQERLKRMKPTGHEVADEEIAKEVAREVKRGPFRFDQVGVAIGSTVCFVSDPTVTATVVDSRHIEYNGEVTSLSSLAQRLNGFKNSPQGTLWFTYNGEILNDLRLRLEDK